ncbi:MAG: UDP-glucose 4-epimerase GalE [Saprospiraceae bacterium]
MKNILVTGGLGYIGSHTVIELLKANYKVHIIDNFSNSDLVMLHRIEQLSDSKPQFTALDLREESMVLSFFELNKDIDGVIHFAALKSVGESVNKPLEYYNNNISGLNNLLKGMAINKVGNLVFSSSCTVYGSPEILPVTEHTPIGFTPSPYGATKQISERIIEDFAHSIEWLSAISLRYFNPIGAHDSGMIGELPSGVPNNLMPYITQTAAGLRKELSVFGDDYKTHDGTAVRDYIHVMDLADAHVKSIDYLERIKTENQHLKINIGTGKGLSVLDIIHSFERTAGIKLAYKIAPRREGDVETIYGDVSLAKQILNWEAKYTVDDMTRSAWVWEKNFRGIQ